MGKRVPDVIPSIPYCTPQPHDGEWEINLTILKSDKDLSDVEPTERLNRKEVSADGWTELPAHKIALPFDNSGEKFGVSGVDADGKPIINGCVYHSLRIARNSIRNSCHWSLNGKEDVGLRNSRTNKRLVYRVDDFGDTTKYFYVITSTPTRILRGTEAEPIGTCESDACH